MKIEKVKPKKLKSPSIPINDSSKYTITSTGKIGKTNSAGASIVIDGSSNLQISGKTLVI